MITSIDKRLKKWYQKYGDLSPSAKSKLKLLLADFAKSSEQKVSVSAINAVKTAAAVQRFVREYKGKVYEVQVENGFYIYNGQEYKSLSGVAFAITGVHWNGKRFFGVSS